MPTLRFGARDLLEYNPKYSILICRECQYAIQKNALGSHMLRHKIYRSERQRLLSSIAQLVLLEPHNVPLPAPGSPSINALPILSGYRCTVAGCHHLTASSKRMTRHWSEVHGPGGSVPLLSSFARPVKLQTFFRGTKVRYFEVASPTVRPVNTDDDGDARDDSHEGYDEQSHNAVKATAPPPPPPPRLSTCPRVVEGPSLANFDLETLTYFHHFIATTSFTLPGTDNPQSAEHYWQMHVILRALRRRWLMCGLLAISARHLAALTDEAMTKRLHRERELQFYSEFSVGLGQTTKCDPGFEGSEVEEEAKKIGEHIEGLLRCARWALAEPTPGDEPAAPCQLQSIMSTIRGCAVPDCTLRPSGIGNDEHELPEKLLVEGLFVPTGGLLKTRNPFDVGNPRTKSCGANMPPALLNRLRALPFRIAEALGRPDSAQDVFATLAAIGTMVECSDISFAHDEVGAAWHGVATWLGEVPDYFNQMVVRHHPAALVVLAHWAGVLVKRAEHVGCWFLKGAAKIIMLQVARQLSVNGRAVLDLVESLMVIVND